MHVPRGYSDGPFRNWIILATTQDLRDPISRKIPAFPTGMDSDGFI